jgi:ParB family chromosome partitioning protein
MTRVIEQIPLKAITWTQQERKYFGAEELAELAATIKEHGLLQPIGVSRSGEGYVGRWGERRCRAAELAGLDSALAVICDKPESDAEAIEIRLIENLQRQNLLPGEQAMGLAELMKAGNLNVSQVAKRVGMKPAAVTKSLALVSLPEPIRLKIDAGLISAAAGYELARIEDMQLQADLAEQVAAGTLNRDALSGRIKSMNRASGDRAKSMRRVTAMLDHQRSVTLSGTGLASVEVLIGWLEELLGKARKARPQNLALGTFIKMLRDQSKA